MGTNIESHDALSNCAFKINSPPCNMAVRYDGQEANTHDLQLSDTLSAPPDSGGGGVYQFGLLSDLLLWHHTYPVTAWEAGAYTRKLLSST